ncbi:helix-turn-helix domain-containing protein [Chitinivibrio alkaliphilus]|uniref:Transcriptional regulator, XRE family n=1 Tax=Chitinivibrio alkaliphilus ACht1 TaxID=1313304 RepID=U7D7I9_9BACT|nr:helix-turn-helix domain-containing protein [Chitinivibrio alkaliphilus]ERP31067.1 transcriptional regulator, XRE family [Chitinivibrio alkaliphilus ACht1]
MDLEKLGSRIRTRRKAKGLTQQQLAASLYISPQAVSKWERGENAPDILVLPRLSVLLDRSIEWIINGDIPNREVIDAVVLVTSLRNFVTRSQEQPLSRLALWINQLYHGTTEAVLACEGVVVKYTGDGVLAYFTGGNYVQRALSCGEMLLELIAEEDMLLTLKAGQIYVGAMGHAEFTAPDILGETVNQAFLLNRWATDEREERMFVSGQAFTGMLAPVEYKRDTALSHEEFLYIRQ